jgi:hypothetical protein
VITRVLPNSLHHIAGTVSVQSCCLNAIGFSFLTMLMLDLLD